jgi:hypothetical protein
MTGAEIIIPAATAIIIQGIQAWIAMARLTGMDEEQLAALFQSELAKFNANTPDKLPDA